jgi:Flp pilus assembly protein TadD
VLPSLGQSAFSQESTNLSLVDIEGLINLGRLDEAGQKLRQLQLKSGTTSRTLFLEGMILYKKKQPVESIEKLVKSLEFNLREPDVYKLIGLNLVSMGRGELAGQYFDAAAKLAPGDSSALYYLSLYYLEDHRFQEAEDGFRKVIQLNPDDLDAQLLLGVVLEQQGREEEAIAAYQRAIEMNARRNGDTKTEKPHLYLGRYLRFLGRYQESVPVLRAALEMNPRSLEVRNEISLALIELEQYEEALMHLQKAVTLDPSDKIAHYQMMRLYRKLGRYEDADREMKIFAKLKESQSEPEKNP